MMMMISIKRFSAADAPLHHSPPLGEFNARNPPAGLTTVKKLHASLSDPRRAQMRGNDSAGRLTTNAWKPLVLGMKSRPLPQKRPLIKKQLLPKQCESL